MNIYIYGTWINLTVTIYTSIMYNNTIALINADSAILAMWIDVSFCQRKQGVFHKNILTAAIIYKYFIQNINHTLFMNAYVHSRKISHSKNVSKKKIK